MNVVPNYSLLRLSESTNKVAGAGPQVFRSFFFFFQFCFIFKVIWRFIFAVSVKCN